MRGTTPSTPVTRSPSWKTSGRFFDTLTTHCNGSSTATSAPRWRQASIRREVEYSVALRDRMAIFIGSPPLARRAGLRGCHSRSRYLPATSTRKSPSRAFRPRIIRKSMPERSVSVTRIFLRTGPSTISVSITGRTSGWPPESTTRIRRSTRASAWTRQSGRRRSGRKSSSTRSEPSASTSSSRTESTCSVEVRAPVSTLALMRNDPQIGKVQVLLPADRPDFRGTLSPHSSWVYAPDL